MVVRRPAAHASRSALFDLEVGFLHQPRIARGFGTQEFGEFLRCAALGLGAPLARRTSRTIVSPRRLRESLQGLRAQRWASGHGEGMDGVGATAALIESGDGAMACALVAVYIHAGKRPRELAQIREHTCAAALAISRALSDID